MNPELKKIRRELPIACTLQDLERTKRSQEVADLFSHYDQVKELTDGYAFRFPSGVDWANRLLQFILFEQNCCAFFAFDLSFEPDKGFIWLSLRGSEGAKAFVQAQFVLKMQA